MIRTTVTRNLQLIASLLLLALLFVFALLQDEPAAERPFDLDSAGRVDCVRCGCGWKRWAIRWNRPAIKLLRSTATSDLLFVYPNADAVYGRRSAGVRALGNSRPYARLDRDRA